MLSFSQHKTGMPVEYPLLSSVGNAIIEYLKHGRPVTDAERHRVRRNSKKGKPLSTPTVFNCGKVFARQTLRTGKAEAWSTFT